MVSSGMHRGAGRRFEEPNRKRRAGDGNVVKVRGLPYSANEGDLTSFFQDYDVSQWWVWLAFYVLQPSIARSFSHFFADQKT